MRTFLTSFALLAAFTLLANNEGFIPNKGQIHDQHRKPNPAVKYLLNGAGMNVQLRGDGFSYDTYTTEQTDEPGSLTASRNVDPQGRPALDAAPPRYIFHRIDLRFMNGNANVEMIAEGESGDYLNYYTDVTGEAGATFVHHYTSVTYKEVWPNIDVRCNATEEGFKYDVIVRPGGSLDDVRLNVEGATISESLKGRLVFTWADGEIEELIPESWIEHGRRRSVADVRYTVATDGSFGFELSGMHEGTLVIDPFPTNPWATYCGGAGDENGNGVAMDGNGNSYMAGNTTSTNVIATNGAHDATHNGGNDAFLVKYNAAGTKLWGTFCGGSGSDVAYGVAAEVGGIAAICGNTSSNAGIGTIGAHQSSFAGGSSDAFLVRFNTDGTRIWGSYLGGAGAESARGIDTGINGDLAICGSTQSTSGIASSGAADVSYGGNSDAFLAQFTSTGARAWGTYLGGSAADYANDVDYTGSYPVVCGSTSSTSGIATTGAYDPTHNGMIDAFVARYHTNGMKLSATYYGGTGDDHANGVTFNMLNRIVFVGRTTSYTQIASTGSAQPVFGGGGSDGFIACFNLMTMNRVWGTYCGGSQNNNFGNDLEGLVAVAATTAGGVAVVGRPFSTDLGTPDAWQPAGTASDGPRPTFVAGYSSAGGKQWAGYPEFQKGSAVAGNSSGVVIAGGGIQTNPLITPPNAHQPGWGGGGTDAFLTKLDITGNGAMVGSPTTDALIQVELLAQDGMLRLLADDEEGTGHLVIRDVAGRTVLSTAWRSGESLDLSGHVQADLYVATLYRSDGTAVSSRFVIP